MKTGLDYKNNFLCVLVEQSLSNGRQTAGLVREWYPVYRADEAEVRSVLGRPVSAVDSTEGTYVDEEGNVYQLMDKAETKPTQVEDLSLGEKSDLEVLLEASLNGRKADGQNGGPKRLLKKNLNSNHKQQALEVVTANPEARPAEHPLPPRQASAFNVASLEDPMRLNLRQKLAEVRRRIGYIQKRGYNERHSYNYVAAADIAGTIGDALAELGVVVIPRLENISYEPHAPGRPDSVRVARVIMAYTFTDGNSGEEITARVAGEGLDAGDKASYKAMTGALKYALLQCFLLATGDDPEDERGDSRTAFGSERPITAEQVRELQGLIEETGTDLERMLAYYKISALSELTEASYRRALELLNRKLTKQSKGGGASGQN